MLSQMSQMETYGEGPTTLMSLGPSPAAGLPATHTGSKKHHHTGHTKAYSVAAPAYLCPIPLKSNSPLPSSSYRRKNNLGMPEKKQRQASEEISHILRRPAIQNFASPGPDQHLLDGSRSADMFVTKKKSGTEGVLHYATPPIDQLSEENEGGSDSDDNAVVQMQRYDSTNFLDLHELREVIESPSEISCIRSASIQDLAVMAETQFTPPTRSQNPLPRSSPFAIPDQHSREGAEIGLLSFSPPNSMLDDDLRARRAQYAASTLSSDFRNRQRFGDITPRNSIDHMQ